MLCHCTHCDDYHRLGDRMEVDVTTACPECGGKSYHSVTNATAERIKDEARKQLADSLDKIDGVGPALRDRVADRYTFRATVVEAGVDALADIEYMSETVAERIVRELAEDRASVRPDELPDALCNVHGVGEGVRDNILDEYGTDPDAIVADGPDGLTDVPRVGETTATRIVDQLV